MKRNNNNVPQLLTPRISARPSAISELIRAQGIRKPPGPGQQGRGHALVSSYPNRVPSHVFASASKVSNVRRPVAAAAAAAPSGHQQKVSSSITDDKVGGNVGSRTRLTAGVGESSQVTSSPRSGRGGVVHDPSSDGKVTRSPKGGTNNLTAHHSPPQRKGMFHVTPGIVLRKMSSTPEAKQRRSRPRTGSEMQKEWRFKYGRLMGVQSARQGGSKLVVKPVLTSKLLTPVTSKPLEETQKGLMHLAAVKDSLKKTSTKEMSLLAPFTVRPAYSSTNNIKKDSPRPTYSSTNNIKKACPTPTQVTPRQKAVTMNSGFVGKKECPQPPPPTKKKEKDQKKETDVVGKCETLKKLKEPVESSEDEEDPQEDKSEMTKKDLKEPEMTKDLKESEMTKKDLKEPEMTKKDLKEPEMTKKDLKEPEMTKKDLKEPEMTNKDLKEPEKVIEGHTHIEEAPCRRCKNLEAREHRRINDLVTENKSLNFMLGQKRSLVLSLQQQVKVLLNENQKLGLRLLMSKKKVEKLEQHLPQDSPEPPPPPPVTPVAQPSTPAELEMKVTHLTHDLRSLQLNHEKTSAFLTNLLYTLSCRGYECVTDHLGNTIDLAKCKGNLTLDIKGRDPRLKSSSMGGGDSNRPKRVSSGQELMLKAVIGSQEEFIRRMSLQFQDLHRASFIRGLVGEEAEISEGVLSLLESAVRCCPSVLSVLREHSFSASSPRSGRLMGRIVERLEGMRETKFTGTVAATGRIKEKMMRSTSGLDNQPSEEGRSRKCLGDEEDCPEEWKDVLDDDDEVPEETKDL